jgi:cytochrome c oxidase subunit II
LRPGHALMFALLAISACVGDERPYPPERPTAPPPGMSVRAWGAKIFRDQGCVGCHDMGGADGGGGSLIGLYGRERKLSTGDLVTADEDYLRSSILNPNAQIVAGRPAVMPSYRDRLGPAELDALVTFLSQLR